MVPLGHSTWLGTGAMLPKTSCSTLVEWKRHMITCAAGRGGLMEVDMARSWKAQKTRLRWCLMVAQDIHHWCLQFFFFISYLCLEWWTQFDLFFQFQLIFWIVKAWNQPEPYLVESHSRIAWNRCRHGFPPGWWTPWCCYRTIMRMAFDYFLDLFGGWRCRL